MSTCKSCGAEVRWVKTMQGKNHPLDATPVPDGEWVARLGVKGEIMVRYTALQKDAPRFSSHFATCPNADRHRTRGAR